MSKTKSLEEGWRDVSLALTSEELDKAVRALMLVVLEEAKAAAGFKHANPSYGWFQACRCAVCILRRRIEELGR